MKSEASAGRFFDPATFRFLRELDRNNNREWFQRNKERYLSDVQAPALRFIEAMGPRLARLSLHLTADPRPFGGSLSRIFRDTRFSKDKSPYKTWVGIHFAHDRATKEENLPGFHLAVAPGESGVSSGVWHPSAPAQKKVRDAIVGSSAAWAKLRRGGVKVQGDAYVRVPAGYDPHHPYAEDLRLKDFYAVHPLTDAEVSSPTFGTAFEAVCRELVPLNEFLAKAMGIPW